MDSGVIRAVLEYRWPLLLITTVGLFVAIKHSRRASARLVLAASLLALTSEALAGLVQAHLATRIDVWLNHSEFLEWSSRISSLRSVAYAIAWALLLKAAFRGSDQLASDSGPDAAFASQAKE